MRTAVQGAATRWAVAWRVVTLGLATALAVGLVLSQVAAVLLFLVLGRDGLSAAASRGDFWLGAAVVAAYLGLQLALVVAGPLVVVVAVVLGWQAPQVLTAPDRVVPLSTAASAVAVVGMDGWVAATTHNLAATIGVLAPLGIGVALGVWVAPRAVRSAARAVDARGAAADGACQDDPGELTDTGRRGAQGPVG